MTSPGLRPRVIKREGEWLVEVCNGPLTIICPWRLDEFGQAIYGHFTQRAAFAWAHAFAVYINAYLPSAWAADR